MGNFLDIWPNDCNDFALEAALRTDESDPYLGKRLSSFIGLMWREVEKLN